MSKLTRRDALAALAAAGAGGYALAAASRDDTEDDRPLGDHERATLVAVAETVYPSEVEGIAEFVEEYVDGRVADRPDRAAGITEAVATVDDRASDWFGDEFRSLDRRERDEVLRQMGVDVVDPDPDGIDASRVRFYLVNELLYGLYTSPTGGELVGIENPQGHPGGTATYQRGP